MLGLKELDEQLEDLRVQQLVTCTDLCGGSIYLEFNYGHQKLKKGIFSLRSCTSSSKAKCTGVWSVCSWKYRGSDTVQSTHFKTPIATTGNLNSNKQEVRSEKS